MDTLSLTNAAFQPRPASPDLVHAVLVALLEQSSRGRPTAGTLARGLGRRPTEVAQALLRLERLGMVDPGRVRLTLRGLAAAVALRGQARRSFARRVGSAAARPAA